MLTVLSETNMTVTPELAGCLFKLDILSIHQIAVDSKGPIDVVLQVLRILKDLALVCGHYGFEILICDDDRATLAIRKW